MNAATGGLAWFVRRPVATTLLSLAVLLCGLLAVRLLPVASMPAVEFPTIFVTASLPGASPETMAATVAAPLERSLGAIPGVSEMSSFSSLGQSRIILQFELERDIDGAAREVQAAINAARPSLPTGMPAAPVYRKANPSDQPVLILQMTSDVASTAQLYDAASTIVAQQLSRVEGVGTVGISGSSLPAVRVEVGVAELAARGVSTTTLRTALAGANQNRPAGVLQDADTRWQVGVNDRLGTAAEYARVLLGVRGGGVLRVGDVARVTDSVEDLRNVGYARDRHGRIVPAVVLVVTKRPDANVLDTVDRIGALLPRLRAEIPGTMALDVSIDRTPPVRASVHEAVQSLWLAVVLVIGVVWLSLRSARAAAIPAVVVPVSLIGTFAPMYLLGHSIDNLSLMALTVATGFVVDDAVVVLENVWRHVERGAGVIDAAIRGVREVGFTVVAMSVSLVAVFIPILAMSGIVGRILREFSVVLAASILISMAVSLTTTPMLCAWLGLRPARARGEAAAGPPEGPSTGPPEGPSTAPPEGRFTALYRRSLRVVLGWPRTTLVVLLLLVVANVQLYRIIPKGFVPDQDVGRLIGFLRADEATSFESIQRKLRATIDALNADPVVAAVVGFTSTGRSNGAVVNIALRDRAGRDESAQQIVERWRRTLPQVPGARLFLYAAQDVRAGGRQGNAQYQYSLLADDVNALREWEPRLRTELSKLPQLADIDTDAEDKGRRTRIEVDRDAAARTGLTQQQISSALNDLFAQRQVTTIARELNQYHVVLAAREQDQRSAEALDDVYVQNAAGLGVPLAGIARFRDASAPLSVAHSGLSASSTVSFNLAPGVSLSEAVDEIDRAMARIGVPSGVHGEFDGNANMFQKSLQNQPWLILAALLTVYAVLGVLYESFVHPLTILSTLPSAGLGALLALMAMRLDFSIIAMIGVILLVGIVKKNAIMMIDFALVLRRRDGLDARAAIESACIVRLRPILMTTAAAMLGALPLALGRGDGAELRQPLGVAVVGGLLVSQLMTLYTTPVVFLALERLRRGRR